MILVNNTDIKEDNDDPSDMNAKSYKAITLSVSTITENWLAI